MKTRKRSATRLGDDESGQPIFQVEGKFFSLHSRLVIYDMEGNEVAQVSHRMIALIPTYEIMRHGMETTEVRKRLFSSFIDRYIVDIPGPNDLEVTGSLFEHEYTIAQNGQTMATVSKHWFSFSDTYGIEIASGQNDVLILATVLALDLAEAREH
jgi:uncharacterized protein YxjI